MLDGEPARPERALRDARLVGRWLIDDLAQPNTLARAASGIVDNFADGISPIHHWNRLVVETLDVERVDADDFRSNPQGRRHVMHPSASE